MIVEKLRMEMTAGVVERIRLRMDQRRFGTWLGESWIERLAYVILMTYGKR